MALEESRRHSVKFPKKKEVGGFLCKEFSELTGWVGQIRNGASIATLSIYACMEGRVFIIRLLFCTGMKSPGDQLRASERVKWRIVFVPF